MQVAPFQANTQKLGPVASPICGGPGTWRVRLRNSGPVAVRVGDSDVTFTPAHGFLLAPDETLEILTDDIVYAIAPPNAISIGQGAIDWIAETR